MKKIIIGVTTAIMLTGASVFAANTISKKNESTECKSNCCCPDKSDCGNCTCCDCCVK